MYQRRSETKKKRRPPAKQPEQISIYEEYPMSYDQQYIQPIPQTIEYSVPLGLSPRDQHKSISSIFQHIQNPVDYERMTESEILSEKQSLENHVKFLNEELNQMVKKKLNKIQEGVSRKIHKNNKNNSRFKYNQWDDAGIQTQVINNRKMLILMRDQYDYLSSKLNRIQHCDLKVKYDNLIKQTKENITKTKLMLFDKKRKNVLNGKKITDMDKRDLHKIYFDYQQQYVTLSKKKEDYTKRVDKIVQENANLVDQNFKLSENQMKLKRQAVDLLSSMPSQMEEEHHKIMYDTKCRKMELSLRKREREEQQYKRKYYGILKEYEKSIENQKNLDQKLRGLMREVETSYEKFKGKQKKVEQIDRLEKNNSSHDIMRVWKVQSRQKSELEQQEEEQQKSQKQQNGFMLTQINNEKSTTRIKKKNPRIKTEQQINQPYQSKSRSNSDYHYKTPKLLPKFKTEYSRGNDSKDHEVTKERASIISNIKQSSRVMQSSNLVDETEVNDYTDDFEAFSPQHK